MSLINCLECNSSISNTLKDCPKCGFFLRKINQNPNFLNLPFLVWVLIFGLILYSIITLINNSILKEEDEAAGILSNKTLISTQTVIDSTEVAAQYISKNQSNIKSLNSFERKDAEMNIRNIFLDQGIDIKVFVYGNENRILELKYSLFNDVWYRKFETTKIFEMYHNMGFNKIILNDEYEYKKSCTFNN